ncbi:hypothetical protein CVIRNUC_006767 [Coccomyxa viridis]|uniref:Uncharacterized protein n=1 Tax=Coccomyxa viridis TaxID=1274662 RepID=A0AAV1ICI6_9CHLO|nr:hypothetical protein CVIRNUC_006767 [Coccomyxa viridis]
MSLQRLQQAMRATKGPWLNRKRKLSHHASSLISSMLEALQRCRATCQAAQAAPTLSAEHAVHLSADLDLAYYSLLEHHLSCGHPVPPVPPPHSYFPALAQAHPGNAAAVKQLVRERAGSYGKEVLRRVWGVRKAGGALELPTQAAADNPLLAVMWARFQESCRLFYASGLALEGALDKVACEEDARIASRAPRVGGMQRSAPFGGAKRRRVSALNTSESSSTSCAGLQPTQRLKAVTLIVRMARCMKSRPGHASRVM